VFGQLVVRFCLHNHPELFVDILRNIFMYAFMRTTIDIPDEIFKKAKITAAEQGVSIKELVIRGLQKTLNEQTAKPDASRLPKLPVGNRKAYDLSNEQIQSLLAAEEAGWYGSSR